VKHSLYILVMFFSLSAAAADSESFLTGELSPVKTYRAPQLNLPRPMSDENVSIHYAGKLTLLHFWASWCIACQKEFPQLEDLHRAFADRGMQIVAVAADSHENSLRYQQDHNLSLTVLVDQYGKALKDFKVRGLPATRLIDSEGNLRYQALGRVDWEQENIRSLLSNLIGDP
jgi:thiol-disulfide isomerase/thioredoxin